MSGPMLCAGDEVDARAGCRRCIRAAVFGGVNQRRTAPPVLVRAVAPENLRYALCGARFRQQTFIVEGRHVYRVEHVEEWVPVPRGLCESHIEGGAAPRAGDVRPHAVEDWPALLIGIESFVEELTQKAAALRNTEAERSLYVRRLVAEKRFGAAELQKRHEIANGSQAESCHNRLFRGVDHLVDTARLKARAGQGHVTGVFELPLVPWNANAAAGHGVAHEHLRAGLGQVGGWVADQSAIAQRDGLHGLVAGPLGANTPGDRAAVV